jgi:hypothetical protein
MLRAKGATDILCIKRLRWQLAETIRDGAETVPVI